MFVAGIVQDLMIWTRIVVTKLRLLLAFETHFLESGAAISPGPIFPELWRCSKVSSGPHSLSPSAFQMLIWVALRNPRVYDASQVLRRI
ncbi:hypothetical protein E2986_12057 [Frieseomelitta varia]|uniref:Uncharacterized protein n=1 Tax=Frieseomelitta varia TaxID=561572 RepID=A0A833S2R3_9HYME|nr:hypothetical protein E2986_12057 [Frieseomelitta varia]